MKIDYVEIYTKEYCTYCTKAKELLDNNNIEYDEYEIGHYITKEDLQNRIDSMGISTKINTVPQIFISYNGKSDWSYIGGYQQLKNILNN